MAVPDFRIVIDGEDLAGKLRPRLISLELTEKRGEEADQLDLVLDDSDGKLALPEPDKELTLSIGWTGTSRGVAPGLVDKGRFRVDEVAHDGAPDTVTIRARSADFTSDLKTRREQSWHGKTLGDVVGDVAKRHGLRPRCADELAGVAVPQVAQSRESDMALLRRLGREHDAAATVKGGALILAPIGTGKSAGGQTLATITLRRRAGDRHSFTLARREQADGVVASYHDVAQAKREEVTIGKKDGARRLSHVYATKASATRAAKAEAGRAKRQPAKLSFTLALGDPAIAPESPASVEGFKPAIDAIDWVVVEVRHSLSKQGFTTALQLEPRGQSAEGAGS